MTFHDRPNSLEDLAFPPTTGDLLARLQPPGRAATDTGAIRFFVPGKPQGKGRPRAAKRGKHVVLYTPAQTVSYESTVALAASQAMAGRPPIEGPVSVVMQIALPIPASWSKKKQALAASGELLPTSKPDMDNVVKAVFDAINGAVWGDDTQVVDLDTQKRYSRRPGVWVAISSMEAAR